MPRLGEPTMPGRRRLIRLTFSSSRPRVDQAAESPAPNGPRAKPVKNAGKYLRKLGEAIHQIEMLGFGHDPGDPQKIVVVGDQGAGKSSVIHAITGIPLPRSSGACIRCPTQITATHANAPWRCDVSIRREYYYASTDAHPTQDAPFYPWLPTPTTISPFGTAYRPEELPELIERAQLAILDEAAVSEDQITLSPNTVCLDISGPGLPAQTVYDLPGVIPSGSPHASTVEALVRKYVTMDKVKVVLCCAVDGDMANSRAMRLVSDVKDRTLGILTKPDRLPRGDPVHSCRQLLDGSLWPCAYGFHVVGNPSAGDEGIDLTTAALCEADHFKRSSPWNDELQAFQERFGVDNLRDRLWTMVAKQTLAGVRNLRLQVEQRIGRIDDELLQPPNDDAQYIVYNLIVDLTESISKQVKGESPDARFYTEWRVLRDNFKQAVSNQCPTLDVSTPGADHSDAVLPQYGRAMSLSWLRSELNHRTTSDVPGELDSRAVDHLRRGTLAHWDEPLFEFIDGVEGLLKTLLRRAIDDTFLDWEETALKRGAVMLAGDLLSSQMEDLRIKVAPRMLRLEQSTLVAENVEALERYKSHALEHFVAERRSTRIRELKAAGHAVDVEALGPDPYAREIEAMARVRAYYLLASNRFIDKICQSVEVGVLFDKFENLNEGLRAHLLTLFDKFENLNEGLRAHLLTLLGGKDDRQERCVKLLVDDPQLETRRGVLRAERETLIEALAALDEPVGRLDGRARV